MRKKTVPNRKPAAQVMYEYIFISAAPAPTTALPEIAF